MSIHLLDLGEKKGGIKNPAQDYRREVPAYAEGKSDFEPAHKVGVLTIASRRPLKAACRQLQRISDSRFNDLRSKSLSSKLEHRRENQLQTNSIPTSPIRQGQFTSHSPAPVTNTAIPEMQFIRFRTRQRTIGDVQSRPFRLRLNYARKTITVPLLIVHTDLINAGNTNAHARSPTT